MQDNPLYEAIVRYSARLLADSDGARDIAQEVFLRLEQNRSAVQNERAWAYRAARNLVIDQLRRSGRFGPMPLDDIPAEATRFNPVILTERKETLEMLEEKLNQLSTRHREVLRLKFQEGLKYAEIADVLGETVTTIAWLIHEAVTKLRKELT